MKASKSTKEAKPKKESKGAKLRAKSPEDLNAELIELRRAQFSLRMQLATQQLNKVDQLGKTRKEVARVKTIMAEKAKQA